MMFFPPESLLLQLGIGDAGVVYGTQLLLEYILDVLFGEVEEILATPVSRLMSRLANLFYFLGNKFADASDPRNHV